MNENDCRDLLLVQAFEETRDPAWRSEDRRWASDEAGRRAGADATDAAWLVTWGRLASERLRERVPAARVLARATRWPAWAGWAAAAAGLLAGLAGDIAASDRFMNLLAPPLLGLLAWNLLVYLGLVAARLHRGGGRPVVATRLARRLLALRLRGTGSNPSAAASHFVAAWSQAIQPLAAVRLAGMLHLGAAALALGVIAGLYLRGLAFEYRAGWASTFLEPGQVSVLLGWLFGPASLLTGIELPDAARLAAMRIPPGPGERAGDWIHLQAATLGLAIVLPRLVLAALASRRERQLADGFAVPLSQPRLAALLRARHGAVGIVQVIPYAAELGQAARDRLAALLAAAFGPDILVRVAPGIAFGDEPALETLPVRADAAWHLVLFRLAATPEREVQLRLVQRLRERLPPQAPLAVLVDGATYRARIRDPERMRQRETAWQRVFDELPEVPLIFMSLDPEDHDASLEALAGATTAPVAGRSAA